jgi:ribosomal protein S30
MGTKKLSATIKHERYIKRNWHKKRTSEIANKLGLPMCRVCALAKGLGFKLAKRANINSYYRTYIKEHWETTTIEVMAQHLDTDIEYVHTIAVKELRLPLKGELSKARKLQENRLKAKERKKSLRQIETRKKYLEKYWKEKSLLELAQHFNFTKAGLRSFICRNKIKLPRRHDLIPQKSKN